MHDAPGALAKGGLGMTASLIAAVSASQEQLAWALGCLVAMGTLVSIGFDIARKWRNRNK